VYQFGFASVQRRMVGVFARIVPVVGLFRQAFDDISLVQAIAVAQVTVVVSVGRVWLSVVSVFHTRARVLVVQLDTKQLKGAVVQVAFDVHVGVELGIGVHAEVELRIVVVERHEHHKGMTQAQSSRGKAF
ncbi:hypothetical protein NADFUDRAFT_53717, partial [Nadsonia fulvescens var. elongata DSM 6958]